MQLWVRVHSAARRLAHTAIQQLHLCATKTCIYMCMIRLVEHQKNAYFSRTFMSLWCKSQAIYMVVVVVGSLRTACSIKDYYSPVLCFGAKHKTLSSFFVSALSSPGDWAIKAFKTQKGKKPFPFL